MVTARIGEERSEVEAPAPQTARVRVVTSVLFFVCNLFYFKGT